MSWTSESEPAGGAHRRTVLLHDGRCPGFDEVLALWRDDADFRRFFQALLAALPGEAWFWETPPVTAALRDRPFEFVTLESPELARLAPDPEPFAEHFRASVETVLGFPSLGGDAHLVTPRPAGPGYAHLAAFARTAGEHEAHALWAAVGEAVEARLSAEPLWLSTAGLGVAWLHVRLDSRPKYVTHRPYLQGP